MLGSKKKAFASDVNNLITHPCLLDFGFDNGRRSRRGHGSAVECGPSLLVPQTAPHNRPQHHLFSWWWLSRSSFVPPVLLLCALTDCRLWCTEVEAPHEFIAVGKLITDQVFICQLICQQGAGVGCARRCCRASTQKRFSLLVARNKMSTCRTHTSPT